MTASSIRTKLYDYIKVAEDKKLKAIYTMLEGDIIEKTEWWKDEKFVSDLNKRVEDFDKGIDKGFSLADIQQEISSKKAKRNGKSI